MSCLQAWERSPSHHMCPTAANQEALGPLQPGLSQAEHRCTGEMARLSVWDIMAMLGLSRTWGFSFSRQRHAILQPFNCVMGVRNSWRPGLGGYFILPKAQAKVHGSSASMSRGTEMPPNLGQSPRKATEGCSWL